MENIGKGLDRTLKSKNLTSKLDKLMEEVMQDKDVQEFITEHREQLTDDDIVKSYAKLYEFVQEKKKYELKDASMIAPGYEPRLFMNFHYIDVTYVPTENLIQKQEQAIIRNRVKAMDMPKDIREARLDKFELTTERIEAFQEAVKFIDEFEDNPKGVPSRALSSRNIWSWENLLTWSNCQYISRKRFSDNFGSFSNVCC